MTVVDFHSHILPYADHGCKDMCECNAQLKVMCSSSTNIAVATPHFYPHVHKIEGFAKKTENAALQIKDISADTRPKICIGAEILLCDGMESMKQLNTLCIKGTNCLLIELPLHPLKHGYLDTAEALLSQGYTLILAHIDRYFKICPDGIDTLISMGALAQINAEALFHRKSLKRIHKYLEVSECICALGSDLHGSSMKSYKHFARASKALKEYYPVIMQRAQTLLSNAEMI